MCWICDSRGEGMIWYKNPKNYARSMYRRRAPGQRAVEAQAGTESSSGLIEPLTRAIEAKCDGDMEGYARFIREADEAYRIRGGTCQVLPLQDCFEVVDIVTPLAKMACICRKRTRGVEEGPKTYSCLGLGTGMLKWERWPERYRGGVQFMTPQEAREWLTYWNKRGMVHMVMNYGGQIGGICNCDYPDCMIIRHRLDYDLKNALLKSEYVAKVDYELCNGCGDCAQRCQFGAIKMEVTVSKANIDLMRCFGCGLCQTGCPRGAINLIDRKTIPALREVW